MVQAKTDPLADWDNLPISHARIGYDNKIISSDTTETDKAITPNTYERWTSASGTISGDFQLSSASTIDYVGIAAHNLFSAGVTSVLVQATTTTGSGYYDVASITPKSNEALMFLFDQQLSITEIRITITGGTNREIGVVSTGKALQMYQPIYGGHSPIDLSASTEYQSTSSETGQFLGRSIIRNGLATSYSFRNLDPIWYRERFQPFVISARTKPFFIKWRPDLYDVAAYGWTNQDIKPSNMGGGGKLMNVSFEMRAHADI